MVKRIKVGINFSHDENWIGGTYYITNLVSSLNKLEESYKPQIIVLSWHYSDFELIRQTGYPYVDFINLSFPLNLLERVINRFSRLISKRRIISKDLSEKQLDVVFPSHISRFNKIKHTVFWIPDFQEMYYPVFFTPEQVQERINTYRQIVNSDKTVVFSSKSAEGDFRKLYPDARNKTFVMNFAVTHPEYLLLDIDQLKRKYDITKKYFIVPNQFWVHKNQIVVLKAMARIKERDDFQVVFTGKESDIRNPYYFNSLLKFVTENALHDIRFLGFIDRVDQLKLMSGSMAIIQPSLFEGWSTVVEDAKAMNKLIILSDLAVHKEQISKNCHFFNPNDDVGLSSEMTKIILNQSEIKSSFNYNDNIKKFANTFIEIIHSELV